MDVFHCDHSRALLEIETATLDSPVELPLMLTGFGKPVEVTNDPDYRNYSLAMKEPRKGFLSKVID